MPKILVIDDNQDNLVSISALLRKMIPGCAVITSDSGEEGIKKAEAELPDTILIDIKMPKMDGFEVCRHLKSNGKTNQTPVVMLTAIKTDVESRVKGLELGADAFLSKPIDETELVAQIKVMLRIKNTEDQLRKEKDKLKKRVEERTAEIVKKNEEVSREITDRRRSTEALAFSQHILEISNKHIQIAPILKELVQEFGNYTGCDAVGIRILDNEGNIPYEAYIGFSKKFYQKESPLSINSDQCMCINVVKGETDPNLPFYTEGGSFYMNGTTRFLGTVSEADKGSTRNTCNQMGYESVALIPICMGTNNFGLIHLADHRDNMVSLEKVKIVEDAAKQLATAIQRIVSEEALRVSEEKFRSLVETTSDWIWEVDQDVVYTYVSPKVKDILGYEQEDMIGKKPFDFMSADEAKRVFEIFMDILASREPFFGLENMNIHKDCRNVVIETSGVPIISKDGILLGYRGIDRDITEKKLLTNQLIRSERLVATGQLAATIAHEINSPLQGITSFLISIERTHSQDERLLEKLNLVKSGFITIRDTVRKLLDLNRPGKERKQSMNINSVIEDTVGLLESHLKKVKIKIILNLSSKVPNMTASPQQLGQVFINLINNGVEAMSGTSKSKDSWEIRESTDGEITINSNLMKNNIIIEVADKGPGIPEEDTEHIFDPFYTRKKEMGIGIGLSLCHGIIEDHNGSITTKNSSEGGAVFTITLPIR